MGSGQSNRPKDEQRIVILVQKSRIMCEHQMTKRERSLNEQQLMLFQNFNKQKPSRSLSVEKAMINRTVYYKNISQIYSIVSTECKMILDRKSSIQTNLDMVQASLQTLVYSASILKEQSLFELQQILKHQPNFKFPFDTDIRYDLIKHHKKTDSVTFEMENSYMLDFCGRANLEMSKLCEVGHQYGYNSARQSFAQ